MNNLSEYKLVGKKVILLLKNMEIKCKIYLIYTLIIAHLSKGRVAKLWV